MPTSSNWSPTLDRPLLVAAINEVAAPTDLLFTQGVNPIVPVIPYDSFEIEFDIVHMDTGLLPALNIDEDVPELRHPGVTNIKVEAPVFRGNFGIQESMLKKLREPGTRETQQTLEQITARSAQWLSNRADHTVEWSAVEMLSTGLLSVKDGGGLPIVVNYRLPPALRETLLGTNVWSDFINSDPLNDIMRWTELLAEFGSEPARLIYGWRVKRYLLQNAKIRTLVQNQAGADLLANGRIPDGLLAGIPHQMYAKTYGARDFVSVNYTAGVTLNLEEAQVGQLSDLQAGDRIVLGPSTNTANPRAKESVTVTGAPAAGAVTLSAALTLDFDVGDPVTWQRPFLHPDDFMMLPATDGMPWAEWWNVPSVHNGNQPGKYATSKILMDDIPFKGWVKGGIDGLPVMFRQGRHASMRVA